eukprot:1023773-Amphidinium_carterae.2
MQQIRLTFVACEGQVVDTFVSWWTGWDGQRNRRLEEQYLTWLEADYKVKGFWLMWLRSALTLLAWKPVSALRPSATSKRAPRKSTELVALSMRCLEACGMTSVPIVPLLLGNCVSVAVKKQRTSLTCSFNDAMWNYRRTPACVKLHGLLLAAVLRSPTKRRWLTVLEVVQFGLMVRDVTVVIPSVGAVVLAITLIPMKGFGCPCLGPHKVVSDCEGMVKAVQPLQTGLGRRTPRAETGISRNEPLMPRSLGRGSGG